MDIIVKNHTKHSDDIYDIRQHLEKLSTLIDKNYGEHVTLSDLVNKNFTGDKEVADNL